MAEGRGSEQRGLLSWIFLTKTSPEGTANNGRSGHAAMTIWFDHVLTETQQHCSGRILDIGAGNCWMSFRLALAGYPARCQLTCSQTSTMGSELPDIIEIACRSCFRDFKPRWDICRFRMGSSMLSSSMHRFITPKTTEATLREALRCVQKRRHGNHMRHAMVLQRRERKADGQGTPGRLSQGLWNGLRFHREPRLSNG